jgi:hypothetical protein
MDQLVKVSNGWVGVFVVTGRTDIQWCIIGGRQDGLTRGGP